LAINSISPQDVDWTEYLREINRREQEEERESARTMAEGFNGMKYTNEPETFNPGDGFWTEYLRETLIREEEAAAEKTAEQQAAAQTSSSVVIGNILVYIDANGIVHIRIIDPTKQTPVIIDDNQIIIRKKE
jgi:hypothetical protein